MTALRDDGNELLKMKKELLLKDYDTAFSSHARHSAHVNSLRTWNLALLVAYLGWSLPKGHDRFFLLCAAALVSLPFLILELREQALLDFLWDDLQEVERILALAAGERFNEELRAYKFRNTRLMEAGIWRLYGRICERKHWEFLCWYAGLAAIAFVSIIFGA